SPASSNLSPYGLCIPFCSTSSFISLISFVRSTAFSSCSSCLVVIPILRIFVIQYFVVSPLRFEFLFSRIGDFYFRFRNFLIVAYSKRYLVFFFLCILFSVF